MSWIDQYANYRGGGFADGWWFGQMIAHTYVNYLRKDPDPVAALPKWLPKKSMGLEEFFDFECKECRIKMNAQHFGWVHYEKGAWCGFLGTIMLFRRFKVHTMDDLMKAIDIYTIKQMEEMRRQQEDVDAADWWKHGRKPGGN